MAADETRVDAADVLAGALMDKAPKWAMRDERAAYSLAPLALAALREAAGGGWVCIAPDGTLHEVDVYRTDDHGNRTAHLAPVEAR